MRRYINSNWPEIWNIMLILIAFIGENHPIDRVEWWSLFRRHGSVGQLFDLSQGGIPQVHCISLTLSIGFDVWGLGSSQARNIYCQRELAVWLSESEAAPEDLVVFYADLWGIMLYNHRSNSKYVSKFAASAVGEMEVVMRSIQDSGGEFDTRLIPGKTDVLIVYPNGVHSDKYNYAVRSNLPVVDQYYVRNCVKLKSMLFWPCWWSN